MKIFFLLIPIIVFNIIIFKNFKTISGFFNFFDKPDGKLKKHFKSVSLIGGSLILLNIYIITFFLKTLNIENSIFNDHFLYIFLSLTTLFYIVGLVDDLKNLTPNKKLLFIISSIILVTYLFPEIKIDQIKISFLENIYYLKFPFSFIFIVLSFALLANSLNMFDGINLQLISFTIFLFILFIFKGFIPIFFILLTVSFLILGLLNYQNKVFLGDGGSYLISSIVGCAFIYQYNNYENFFFGDEVFIILLIPAIDMLRLFFSRILNKKHPFNGDLNHLHHIVNRFTKNQNITVLATIGLCIIPSFLLFLNLSTYVIFILCLILYFSLVAYLRYKK